MRNGKMYQKILVNGKPVQFTVGKRIGLAVAEPGAVGCGDPDCKKHEGQVSSGDGGEERKIEAALTSKGTLVLRRLNYSKGREESHQVFESVPHLIANLNTVLPEEALLATQLTTFNETGMTASEAVELAAKEEAKKNAPEEI